MTAAMLDDAQLRAESQQIERVLEELRELVVPAAWQRIEQVMRITVALYGAGLAHALELARQTGAGRAFDQGIIEDELLASLLVLHGLHPLTIEERVQRTLAAVRSELGIPDDQLTIASLGGGTLELASTASLGGSISARVAEGVIRHALEAAAPELAAIQITGIAQPVQEPKLVQLRVRREEP
jgi:hypothetical protein